MIMKKILTVLIIIIIIFIIFYIIENNFYFEKFENNIDNEKFGNNKIISKYNSIPKIIIQTWKTDDIPDKYIKDIESVKKYNKDFKYLFFTDKDIESFLKKEYPLYYYTYTKLPLIIQKIDFFRYIAVYHYGGFYFDLDMTGLESLDELIKYDYDCIFPVDQNIPKEKCNHKRLKKYCEKDMKILLGQYAFGAKPKNRFIKKLIDTIHSNINIYIEKFKTEGKRLQYVYSSTGPDFVTDVYIDYPRKNDIHILEYNTSQYFGKYAKHNYYGTWK